MSAALMGHIKDFGLCSMSNEGYIDEDPFGCKEQQPSSHWLKQQQGDVLAHIPERYRFRCAIRHSWIKA